MLLNYVAERPIGGGYRRRDLGLAWTQTAPPVGGVARALGEHLMSGEQWRQRLVARAGGRFRQTIRDLSTEGLWAL